MKFRTVSNVLFAHAYDMGGLPVRQPFPTTRVQQVDPFVLLHHANIKVPNHTRPEHGGVGPHPHRGFSPVTFIFEGGVHHRDSRGNNEVIYAGGVQWMHAGMGIIHSERPPADIHTLGGRQEIIQLWINSPAAEKMAIPSYFPLSKENIPVVTSEDGRVDVNIVAGTIAGVKGPIPTLSPVNAATIVFKAGGRWEVELPEDHNAFVYLLDGQLRVEGYGLVEALHAVVLNKDGEGIGFEAKEDTRALLMTGLPLEEKLVTHGPFVMNSETQILEAMRDYQMGKMGVLIEE